MVPEGCRCSFCYPNVLAPIVRDVTCQRKHWDIPPGQYYFDGAGKAMLPRVSVEAGATLVTALSQPWTVSGE